MTNAISRPRHFMPQGFEVLAGISFFILGAWFLYQAYGGRGRDQPKILRPFSFW